MEKEMQTFVCPMAGTSECKGHEFSMGGADLGCFARKNCAQYENGCGKIAPGIELEDAVMRCPLTGFLYHGKSCGKNQLCGWYGVRIEKKEA